MNREVALSLIRSAAPELERLYGVRKAVLFGSVARDQDSDKSDIDVAVSFGAAPRDVLSLCGVSGFLSERLGRSVDVVSLPPSNALLAEVIDAEGHVAF